MLLAIIIAAIKALSNDLVQAVFGMISNELEDRKLIAQGKAAQYTADLQASIQQARDAAVIMEQVAAMPISDVDDRLERLRHPSTASPK